MKPPHLSREGRSKVKQQIAQQPPYIRRASLPPEERVYTTSYHHVGTRAGLHPEDQPYETHDKDDVWPSRMATSSIVYSHGTVRQDADGNPFIMVGNRPFYLHEGLPELPPQRASRRLTARKTEILPVQEEKQGFRPHWLVFVGLAMLFMLASWVILTTVANWWQVTQDDWHYGRPRTFQINAVVGHNDSPTHPSHFIALNLNGRIEVIEIPGGDPTHERVYIVATLIGDGQDLQPVTLSFKGVNGDGNPDMLIHIGDQTIVFLNDGGGFRPVRPTDHIHL